MSPPGAPLVVPQSTYPNPKVGKHVFEQTNGEVDCGGNSNIEFVFFFLNGHVELLNVHDTYGPLFK